MPLPTKSAVTSVLLAVGLVLSGCSDSDVPALAASDTDGAESVEQTGGQGGSGTDGTAPSGTATTPAATPGVTTGGTVIGDDQTNQPPAGEQNPVADQSQPTVDSTVTEPENNPVVDTVQANEPAVDNNGSTTQPAANASSIMSLGADTSGGDDDSPTLTESLSLYGASIKDASRGAGPPSAPTGLTKLMAAENWVEFSWVPSTDDQSVKAYEIYRDGALIATVRENLDYEHDYRSWLSTSFIDCNFTRYKNCVDESLQPLPGASYAYSVAAIDNEGMRSPRSEEIVLSMATPQQSTVNLAGYTQVFADEFEGNRVDSSKWRTSLAWGENTVVNGEMQYYVNLQATVNPVTYDPFIFTNDTLQLTGIKTPAAQVGAANNQPFLSGVLSTLDRFSMTYGYVEMRAKLPAGKGLLPTYYLFNQNFEKNKPEIDVIEYLGSRPNKIYQTYHYYDSNRARFPVGEKHSTPTMETVANEDLSSDFHNYSVLWEPELVVWYIDGREVRRLEGPRISDEPMNIVIQLVMGSDWIGEPDQAALPAVLEIDFVRAWQK